jgi:hypothetical protein
MHVYCAHRQTKTCPSNYKGEDAAHTSQYKADIAVQSTLKREETEAKKRVMFDRQRANSATEKISAKVGVG